MTVKTFRKKPVVISAVQWTGDNLEELYDFTHHQFDFVEEEDRLDDPDITAQVYDKLHSTWVGVYTGQWVIEGVKGEFYPCDEEVLAETYDEVIE